MKTIIKTIIYFFLDIKLIYLKLKSKVLGDYILNRYFENCSKRALIHVLNKVGARIHESTNLREGLVLDNTNFNYSNLVIGDNCYIGKKVFLDMVRPIIIKKEAVVSAGVTILTHQDVGDRMLNQYYKRKEGEVILNEGCFIGVNSTILCGIKVGKCSVVAANSVVTRDVPDYTVVGGVPAKVIRNLE